MSEVSWNQVLWKQEITPQRQAEVPSEMLAVVDFLSLLVDGWTWWMGGLYRGKVEHLDGGRVMARRLPFGVVWRCACK